MMVVDDNKVTGVAGGAGAPVVPARAAAKRPEPVALVAREDWADDWRTDDWPVATRRK